MSVSVASQCSIKTAKWTELVFGMEASFQSTYHTLCCKDNSQNNPSLTSSKMLDLENFVTAAGLMSAVNKSITRSPAIAEGPRDALSVEIW